MSLSSTADVLVVGELHCRHESGFWVIEMDLRSCDLSVSVKFFVNLCVDIIRI